MLVMGSIPLGLNRPQDFTYSLPQEVILSTILVRFTKVSSEFVNKQECIPAGCVPAARRPYAGVCLVWGGVGVLDWGGVCLVGGSAWSGVVVVVSGPGGGGVCLVWGGGGV